MGNMNSSLRGNCADVEWHCLVGHSLLAWCPPGQQCSSVIGGHIASALHVACCFEEQPSRILRFLCFVALNIWVTTKDKGMLERLFTGEWKMEEVNYVTTSYSQKVLKNSIEIYFAYI